ncbi:MAG: hypothetical protein GTO55_03190, partial [Armatimonadetes bacterium]|nr:hypothetical protein [Armatimonadota bacterium]NIM23279.1 hypothetical protein [Armatimonadota bacterium]NIM67147.1 hypothetical protein [Armatimonadota bacterium]NIM75673.1 hypothetical protein [Armatimonadota bacterium]NIN05336.1 hypothetical protein [Armatimonadota bacterium]
MPVISSYRDFFVFVDRLAETKVRPWALYCECYFKKHEALLTAWWEQCMGLPAGTVAGKSEEVWRRRVENVRVEHYSGIRALLDSCSPEEAVGDALRRCQSLLPAPEPKVNLMVGFFSPDGFIL